VADYLLYSISKECNLEIALGQKKVFGFVGTDHLRTKIFINNETLGKLANLRIYTAAYLTNFQMM
jgi:hypothetical protein